MLRGTIHSESEHCSSILVNVSIPYRFPNSVSKKLLKNVQMEKSSGDKPCWLTTLGDRKCEYILLESEGRSVVTTSIFTKDFKSVLKSCRVKI